MSALTLNEARMGNSQYQCFEISKASCLALTQFRPSIPKRDSKHNTSPNISFNFHPTQSGQNLLESDCDFQCSVPTNHFCPSPLSSNDPWRSDPKTSRPLQSHHDLNTTKLRNPLPTYHSNPPSGTPNLRHHHPMTPPDPLTRKSTRCRT